VEEIYRAHFGFVWAVLRRLGVPERDLEDVAQDVFVVVHRRLAEFEGRAATRTWLYAIAVRVAWNHARRRRVREPAAETSGSRLIAPALGSDPEEHAVRNEAACVLDDLLGRLDEDKRAVFVLSEIEGLTAVEIAAIVGTNPRTVYSRLRAARDRVHGDLARMRSRESSASERRQWLRTATADDGPPRHAERRVWAALALQLPIDTAGVGTSVALAGAGLSGVVQAVTVSVALGVAGLGAVWVAAAPLRDDPGRDARSRPNDDRLHGPVVEAQRAGPDPAARRVTDDPETPPTTVPAEPPAAAPMAPRTRPTATVRDQPSHAKDAEDDAEDTLLLELPLLERARDALAREDPAAAVHELDAHARRFPDSPLAPERDRLRAQATVSAAR
jgi:RNA polymerase sigma-70 factor, ECF subfamily